MPTSKTRLSPPFPTSTTTVRPLAAGPNGLPLVFLDADGCLRHFTSGVPQCLNQELSIDRLNTLHRHLWWAGLPTHARPLHRQAMLGRSIIPTSEARYHLLWRRQQIFVKPLPEYLPGHGFWEKGQCGNDRLHELASGFLLSWVWLVRSEVDFGIARKRINAGRVGVEGLVYGELRIDRLNQICRFIAPETFRDIVKGYYSGYLTYGNFFAENFAWLVTVFAFTSVLLSAFQVGATVGKLESSFLFQNFAYSVAMSSIVSPFLLTFLATLLFLVLFGYHLVQTIIYQKEKRKLREKWDYSSE
ncbi:hypothetical protein G7Y79_00018g045770 [Physcia stellaris]|nr:hypothetical protein G7Y79_00018g045770 [Physcia stellaris]